MIGNQGYYNKNIWRISITSQRRMSKNKMKLIIKGVISLQTKIKRKNMIISKYKLMEINK